MCGICYSHNAVCRWQGKLVCTCKNSSLWIVSRRIVDKLANEKTSKIKDIKETVCGAAEIIRQIGAGGIQESFGNIMDTALIAKEIIEALRTPEMVKNIENFRLISEKIENASTKMQNTLRLLEEMGIIYDTKELIKSATSTAYSLGNCGQDLHGLSNGIKEIFKSIRVLVDNIKLRTVS